MADHNHEVAQPFEPLPPPAGAKDGPRRILLVEDDAGDALLVQERLRDAWPELELVPVTSLAEAEVRLSSPVDCVLLDLGLPDVKGIGSLVRLQAAAPETAVVVLTGDTDRARGIEALSAGAQDYIVKGDVDGEGLARAIGYSIQRKFSERTARELAVLRVQSAENARVHRGLVPRPLLEDRRISVRSAYHPGNRRQVLGGDFFDVVQTAPDCIFAVLGDVCGRGPDEAALGVQLRIAWRTLILAGTDQQAVLKILDRLTNKERHAEHIFATLASVRIDLRSGVAEVALAGHPPPILAFADHAALLVDRTGGPPLGLMNEADWDIAEVELGDKWTLLFYSDGVYEGFNGDSRARLGLDGFVELLSDRVEDGSLWLELPDPLIERMETLNGGPLDDDVALLALRFDGDAT
jgi:serine phosphatase RsbU (regulator of sigma subunit)